MYTVISVFSPRFHSSLEAWMWWAPPAILPGSPQLRQNEAFSTGISSWGTGKSFMVQIQVNRMCGEQLLFFWKTATVRNEWCGSECVVMMENPVVLHMCRHLCLMLSLSHFKIHTVKCAIDCLTRTVPWISKNTRHVWHIANLTHIFFGRSEYDDFYCDDFCFISES